MADRVGLTPTSGSAISAWRWKVAATIQNAAELRSPGTRSGSGSRRAARLTSIAVPSTLIGAAIAASIRSVWSRVRTGSTIRVTPSAWIPARSSADFTWALGVAISWTAPVSLPPPTFNGRSDALPPIFASGTATRSIGRALRDSSPISVVSNGWPASRPASSLIVVPELPQSSGP